MCVDMASTGWRITEKVTNNSVYAEHLIYNYPTIAFSPPCAACSVLLCVFSELRNYELLGQQHGL
jgi:hypothetical protein